MPRSSIALGLMLTAALACRDGTGPTPPASQATATTAAIPAAGHPFRCDQINASRPYAFLSATGTLDATGRPTRVTVFWGGVPTNVYSRAARGTLFTYPGFPSFRSYNVTGGPAIAAGNDYYLLFPRVLPGPGGAFAGEIHALYNHGAWGWNQSLQNCVIS